MKVVNSVKLTNDQIAIGYSAKKATPYVTIDGNRGYLNEKVVSILENCYSAQFDLVEYDTTVDENGETVALATPFQRWEFAGAISQEKMLKQAKFNKTLAAVEAWNPAEVDIAKLVAL